MTQGQAIACVIPTWLLFVILSMVSEFIGGMAG
jgi:hypothetical protein